MSIIKKFIKAGILLFFIAFVCAYYYQDKLLFIPSQAKAPTPDSIGLFYEDVYFKTQDGYTLHGWFVPAYDPKGVVLFMRGATGNITYAIDQINIFAEMGLSTFIFDWRGFGESEGTPGETGFYFDSEAAWDWLLDEKDVYRGDIVIYGRSLGGPVAARLASMKDAGALVLESTFTSLGDIASDRISYLPVRGLLKSEFDTVKYATRVTMPTLVIHSREDEVIPYSHGIVIAENLKGYATFLKLVGVHDKCFIVSRKEYTEGMMEFLEINVASFFEDF